jgi:hypothetical protein
MAPDFVAKRLPRAPGDSPEVVRFSWQMTRQQCADFCGWRMVQEGGRWYVYGRSHVWQGEQMSRAPEETLLGSGESCDAAFDAAFDANKRQGNQ